MPEYLMWFVNLWNPKTRFLDLNYETVYSVAFVWYVITNYVMTFDTNTCYTFVYSEQVLTVL